MAKTVSVAEAMRKEASRSKKAGPTVLVRATRRGQYGRPLASIREPGKEFRMRISDLAPYKPGKDYLGQPFRFITHEGKQYQLPSWVEDAAQPSSLKRDENEDEEEMQMADDQL